MNLLIVDDEQFAIQGMLDGVNWELLGFDRVFTAGSYDEAVGIVRKTYVDILLSDIEMPGESGLKLIEYMNADEVHQIQQAERHDVEFIKLWTQKEAVLKLSGEGISNHVKQVLVDHPASLTTVVSPDLRYIYSYCFNNSCSIG